MATNNFKAFALDPNANVTPQADWESLPALLSGFTAGKASSAQVNKAIRQSSFIAAAVAQYVVNKTNQDVLDNGNVNGFINQLIAALAESPNFTGVPTVPDTHTGNYGEQAANTKFVRDVVNELIDNAPSGLNTLRELAAAINNDPSFYSSVNTAMSGKLAKSQNGADIPDTATFRTNIGVKSASVRDVGTGANQIPDMSSFGISTSANGWCKLPNGLIIQWGRGGPLTPAAPDNTVSFNISFPNECLFITEHDLNNAATMTMVQLGYVTTTGFSAYNLGQLNRSAPSGLQPVISAYVQWIAIGY
ncbi:MULTISPECIES: gp53-like domain-containing protein [unclassified Enterobacter]|uniref:gp53-like domain-containing protein n=1 Tax=unclassified Enterobacter TaxID=2608935 RepID=UPI001CC12045|nr:MULTISPECIES: phage tail protein [unclassified Enterobacter]UXP25019.1 phage tail protein [Enterobacter sp. 155105]